MAKNSCPRKTRYRRIGGKSGPRCLRTKRAALKAKASRGGMVRVVTGRNRGDVLALRPGRGLKSKCRRDCRKTLKKRFGKATKNDIKACSAACVESH